MSRIQDEVSRRYAAACGARGMFALEADVKRAVKAEWEARRDELRKRLDETHAAVIELSRELSACEMDLRELK